MAAINMDSSQEAPGRRFMFCSSTKIKPQAPC
jgi:hypothetical protein